MIHGDDSPVKWLSRAIRFAAATLLTVILVVFLIATRLIHSDAETLTLRSIEGTDPVSLPAPPPPPTMAESRPQPPPPADPMELPKLDLELQTEAPPIKAAVADREIRFDVLPAEFAAEVQAAKPRSLFSSSALDDQPRLLHRPVVNYPPEQLARGIREGKVTLEVLINAAGGVTVRRVLSSSNPAFVPMARAFAGKSRFSPPKKDGRPVNAVFKWPLVLRP